jgi:glutathione-regulated potassium-efflux system ancillary protein KefG
LALPRRFAARPLSMREALQPPNTIMRLRQDVPSSISYPRLELPSPELRAASSEERAASSGSGYSDTPMARILILFAHPALEKSRVHRRLVEQLPKLPNLTFQDLYEAYPHFDIDVPREQQLLVAHDIVILQHPFFWYSTPAILKQWQDLVLEHGWAYGSKGKALQGKKLFNLMTTGGRATAYRSDGHNRYTIRQMLVPIEQTIRLCNMEYLPPYIIYGTHWMSDPDFDAVAQQYRALLVSLHDDQLDLSQLGRYETFNEALGEAGVRR